MNNKFTILLIVLGIAVFFYPIKAVSKVEFPKPLFQEQPESGFFIGKDMRTCNIEGCNEKHLGKGLCRKHYMKQWRKDNKKYKAEYDKQWYKDNLEYRKKWRRNNKGYFTKHFKQWSQTLSGKASIKAYQHNRRLLIKDLTKETVQRVYEDNIKKYGVLTCYLCFRPIINNDDCLEHSTSLIRNGTNEYDNLNVAHRSCNNKKRTMTLDEWFKKQKGK